MPTIKKNPRERYFEKKSKAGKQEGRKERSKEYDTNRWRSTAKTVRYRDKFLCQECLRNELHTEVGLKPHDHAVDHIQPVREGGDFYDLNNLQLLCSSCHNSKSGKERHKKPNGEGGGQK